MKLTRILVAVLIVGVVAVSVDATALACEVACASPQPGAVASHEHGVSLQQHESGAMAHHGTHGQHMMHETNAPPDARGEALHQGAMEQCVTINEVALQIGAGRIGIAPLVAIATPHEADPFRTLVITSEATIAGSPPARNGPPQPFSVLRI